jgi:hypothetical protein
MHKKWLLLDILLAVSLTITIATTLYVYSGTPTPDYNEVSCGDCGLTTSVVQRRGFPLSFHKVTTISTQNTAGTIQEPLPGYVVTGTKVNNYFAFIADWFIWFTVLYIVLRILPTNKLIFKKSVEKPSQ